MPGNAVSPSSPRTVGLLAGHGELPRLVAEGVRAQGHRLITAGLVGEYAAELPGLSAAFTDVKIGALGTVFDHFAKHGVQDVVMVGTFRKTDLFSRFRPDLTFLKLVARVGRQLADDRALREVARMFEEQGMGVVPVPRYIPTHMAPAGVMTRRKPTADESEDITYGMQVARTVGSLDVGQTVVVRRGTVLAVETVEGTDKAIARGAELGRNGNASGDGGVVVCKVVKPTQDLRLDLPAVGPRTIEACAAAGVTVLAVEARRTIMVDRPATVALAEERKLILVGVENPDAPPDAW
jgi:DUF1009 family protein